MIEEKRQIDSLFASDIHALQQSLIQVRYTQINTYKNKKEKTHTRNIVHVYTHNTTTSCE